MTKWTHLLQEGKALSPSPSMRKAADILTKYIEDTITDWFHKGFGKIDDTHGFAPAFRKYLDKLEKLLAIRDDISIGRRSDPYGKKRVKVVYGILDRMRGDANAVVVPLDPDDTDPDFKAWKKAGFDFALLLKLSAETLGDFLPGDANFNRFLSAIRETLLHEMTHIIDPKVAIKFIKQQEKYRTRKGYPIPASPKELGPGYDKSFARYVNSPVEQETWTRSLARRLIYQVYKETKSVDAVDKMTRKPPKLSGYGLSYGAQDKGVLDIWRRSPNRWKRFLRTLRDEYEIFAKDPVTYTRYGHFRQTITYD